MNTFTDVLLGICFSAQGHLSMSKLPPKAPCQQEVHFMGGYGPFLKDSEKMYCFLYIKNIVDMIIFLFFFQLPILQMMCCSQLSLFKAKTLYLQASRVECCWPAILIPHLLT